MNGHSRTLTSATLLALSLIRIAEAQDPPITGDWHGRFEEAGGLQTAAVYVTQDHDGAYSGRLSFPDSGIFNMPIAASHENGVFTFEFQPSGLRFEGTWQPANAVWSGSLIEPGKPARTLNLREGLYGPVARGIGGNWEGTLSVRGLNLRTVFRVTERPHNTTAVLDSPDQLQTGIPVSSVSRQDDTVTFDLAAIDARYVGQLNDDGRTMTGNWSQIGMSFPLDLKRLEPTAGPPNRPQTPQPPFPYSIEEVVFDNPAAPGVRLACTLTIPDTAGPHPAAVMLTGSGAQDRDATLFGHKPFWVVADHLSRHEIAVLRCDDRGFGESTGVFNDAVPEDFVTDAEAALAFLRTRDDIDPARTGIIGHSQGAVIGPMVASRDPDLAFLVMMAGRSVPGVDLAVAQGVELARAAGAPEPLLEDMRKANRDLIEAVVAAPDPVSARSAAETRIVTGLVREGMDPEAAEAAAEAEAERMSSPYMLTLLKYDPGPVLRELTLPVLAIYGSLDVQVPAWQSLPVLRDLFADHADATVLELEGLNHAFQNAKTGAPGEYGEIEETFAPVALNTISDWITERMLTD